ncbi:MAG: metallophosphoesterase [Nitrososphaerota archaeon]|nr:metallophosphoesterase [Candidatus Bathyarchaeota archaeon]MDW8062109.1 metallophosphoesterase [Nitrososphaerota archaeon]
MRIGVISDTHDNLEAVRRAASIFAERKVSSILHAGDWCAPFTMRTLVVDGCKVVGVYGNVDGERLMLRKTAEDMNYTIEDFQTLELKGVRIALLHGTVEAIVEGLAKSNLYDLIVRGHTHKFEVKKIGNTVLVNPGEACGYLSGRKTAVIIDLPSIQIEVVEL